MTAEEPTGLALLARKVRSARHLVRHRGGRAVARAWNVSLKHGRHYGMRFWRAWRIVTEKVRNVRLTLVNLARLSWRRLLTVHKPLVRLWRRRERAREQVETQRFEAGVERDVRRRIAEGRPLILGPWISEVGFEVLYWVPFLRWLRAEANWDPSRALAISRGGVRSWYRGLADQYVELFEQMTPSEFAVRNEARRAAGEGSHKQLALSELDAALVAVARARPGFADAVVVHPSDMYQLFRQFWLGHRGPSFVQERTRFTRLEGPGAFNLSRLPADFVAVKAYTAQSLPDSPANRAVLRSVIATLAAHTDVVTLDTGLAVDDHADYELERHPRVHNLAGLLTPANNLELQTEVMARARGFVGTCGSLTWLAPMLGVPTVALFSDARFLHAHLYLARKVYLDMGAAPFQTVDVTAAGTLGIDLAAVAGRATRV
ncbi:MAG: hypothetical protein AB7O67_04190 [Vicinamibacterales bacterium]